jgi:hypothetical protein
MPLDLVSNMVSIALGCLFAVAAGLHLKPPAFLREGYERSGYGNGFRVFVALLLGLSALFLLVAQTRIWGGALSALIVFVTVVGQLHRGRYARALLGIAVMLALPLAMVSGMMI